MPLIKHTQNDIEAFVNAASFLTQQRKKELLQRLPEYYQCICGSLLLPERLATDLLFMFPQFSDDEIRACCDMLDEESTVFQRHIREDLSGAECAELLRSLESILRSSTHLLHRGSETLAQCGEQKLTEQMEQEFSNQP